MKKIPLISLIVILLCKCNYSNEKQSKMNNDLNLTTQNEKMKYFGEPLTDSSRFVLLLQGLKLYKEKDTTSEVIKEVNVGERIEIVEATDEIIRIGSLKGSIIKVDYQGTIGYIFSGGLGHYPIPSFAFDRKFYQQGDMKLYVAELKKYGAVVECESENCAIIEISNLDSQEAYLIVKLLWPGLMANVPFLNEEIINDENAETMANAIIGYDLEFGNETAEAVYGETEVYYANKENDSGEVIFWNYDFYFQNYSIPNTLLRFKKSNHGKGIIHQGFVID
ncbi:SH3 domain-containing protein [Marinigracilibium pacificum]|uniref:SH3 domain-containing protein n=1 Tax=Marinigracilibium pacificum TaxID=2729599 RepID=A0A848J3I4_9BACT|nr:SH3 domain-containing protein [Marinigracilibium pacificum]NMM50065.1 SH3 domain-containing protein [Marinigracilibium pacificum]